MAIRVRNLTPHDVNLLPDGEKCFATFTSEGNARASQQAEHAGELDGVEVVSMKFGETVDLPDPEEGTFLIVSVITLDAARAQGRDIGDLLMTADPVRNDKGQIIGCRRLATKDPEAFERFAN